MNFWNWLHPKFSFLCGLLTQAATWWPNYTILTSSVKANLKAMTTTVFWGPSLGLVRHGMFTNFTRTQILGGMQFTPKYSANWHFLCQEEDVLYLNVNLTYLWGILVKKVIFIEKGNTFVMTGHTEKIDVTIEIISQFWYSFGSRMP